jgi:hypothetical protein
VEIIPTTEEEVSKIQPLEIEPHIEFDEPPSSLMDPTVSPKVKTLEGEGVGALSLVRSTLG